MYKTTILASATLCGFLLLHAGCATEEPDGDAELLTCDPIPKDRADRDMLEAIEAMGLCASSAVDVGDGYRVEGDIYIPKTDLLAKQGRTNRLVSTANIRDVTVRVGDTIPVGGDDDWRTAVQTAVAQWNAVSGTLVRFVYTTDTTQPADIVFIANDFLGDHTVGESGFPHDSVPFSTVQINLTAEFNTTLTEAQKVHTALHELGHCIGLRHTDWETNGELVGAEGASHINGTPHGEFDSVMTSRHALHETWLTANDRLAIQLVYPEIVTLNVEYTGCTSGTPRMAATWGGTLVQPTQYWQLDRWNGSTWTQVYLGAGQNWTFLVPTGQSLKTRVRGHSAEGWSTFRTVTKTAPSCSTLPP